MNRHRSLQQEIDRLEDLIQDKYRELESADIYEEESQIQEVIARLESEQNSYINSAEF